MAETNISSGSRSAVGDVVGPIVQASTASIALVTGSALNASAYRSVAFTISVITNSVDYTIFGANVSDFSDEVIVQVATTVAAAATGSYAVPQAPFRYYRMKIIDTSGGSHGTATVNAVAK